MHRWFVSAVVAMLLPRLAPAAMPQRVVFDGATSEQKWMLKDLDPALPHDWTDFKFLVLEMKVSSPQRFELAFFSGDRAQRRQMQPFAGVWIRASVPLENYRTPKRTGTDLASIGKVARNTFWISTGGTMGPLNAVDAIGVTMRAPLGKPTLEIRSVRLEKEDPGSDVLDRKPVVDQFGQWIPADWPGKIIRADQLKQAWADEEKGLGSGDFGWCKYGGYRDLKAKATGFFRVEQVDGRWWFVDPDGICSFRRVRPVWDPAAERPGCRGGRITSRRCPQRMRVEDGGRRRGSSGGIYSGDSGPGTQTRGSIWICGGWSRGD